MDLNALLTSEGLNPETVIVLRHRPTEPRLNRALPFLAENNHEIFNAYQQTQTEQLEAAMTQASYIASFIAHGPGKALFVGIYKIGETKPLAYEDYWKIPQYIELRKLDMRGYRDDSLRKSVLWFDLELTKLYSPWKGKLIIEWPPPERSWWRRAHRNSMPVLAILEDSALVTTMPSWDELQFSWAELAILPKRWQAKLAEWRGVYLIFDSSDSKSYIGSAYGPENILARWLNYASTGHGGNTQLRKRNPNNFTFSILELVSPTMPSEDVIRTEASWKARLHTRSPHGLNDN